MLTTQYIVKKLYRIDKFGIVPILELMNICFVLKDLGLLLCIHYCHAKLGYDTRNIILYIPGGDNCLLIKEL